MTAVLEQHESSINAPQKAAVPLYEFQRKWIADKSRLKAAKIARQSGKSFMVSLDSVLEAAETGINEILLSSGERQSKELMEKAQIHARAIELAASDIEEGIFRDEDKNEYLQLTIRLPNGAKLIALPANPNTARGFTGNVTLDEFAFHRDSFAIWKALFPIITRGYKLRVVSTPQGKQNKFYSVMTGENGFSRHSVDIYQAVADGVPADIEELRKGLDDPEAWEQEYEVKFVDEATAFLIYELIASCESDLISPEIDYENFTPAVLDFPRAGRRFVGMDIGRKKDLTVIWVIEMVGDVAWTRAIIILRKVPFTMQRDFLWQVMQTIGAERTCIDATGLGMQIAEETVKKFGDYAAEAVTFTLASKNEMATRTKRKFEDRLIRIPISQPLRNDLHSVQKIAAASDRVRFEADHGADGHADRFWGGSLALKAAAALIMPQVFIM